MAVTLFASIDVGSHETSLRIYEISKKGGVKELEYLHHTARLGYETYATGHISYAAIDKLCTILNGFSEKMAEYHIKDYMIIGTSALREADNSLIVLDQVKQRTGFSIKILSNSEQRYLCYKAIALQPNAFHKLIQKGTLLVDVGGGSIQLSLFNHNKLISTHNIKLGSLRIQNFLQSLEGDTLSFQTLVSEYISNGLHPFDKLYLGDFQIKNIIAVGNQLLNFAKYLSTHNFGKLQPIDSKGKKRDSITRDEYEKFYQGISNQSTESIARELNIAQDKAELLLPTAMIYHHIFASSNAEMLWLSGITICDGMAADFAERKEKIIPAHSFQDDIISASTQIAKRYNSDMKHNAQVENAALMIFDTLMRNNHLTKRDRLLLQIAIILHNCGSFITINEVGESSYKIVTSTEIIGLSHQERMIVASIVRYQKDFFPEYAELRDDFTKEEYIRIVKLNAIFCLANATDSSHKQKFNKLSIHKQGQELLVIGHTLYDIAFEQGMFQRCSSFFEEAFGIRPILKQRKNFE